jgi:hypothetical protein
MYACAKKHVNITKYPCMLVFLFSFFFYHHYIFLFFVDRGELETGANFLNGY